MSSRLKLGIALFFLVCLIGGVVFGRSRFQTWRTQLQHQLSPPEEVVFVPAQITPEPVASATPTLLPTSTLIAPTASTIEPSATLPSPTPTPSLTPIPPATAVSTPLPVSTQIDGISYQDQHGLWNYCGPANLAMQVSYWGWETDRLDAGAFMRGSLERYDDKNVNPDEMAAFVHSETELNMLVRVGGDLYLLRELLAFGFPVILEKDFFLDDVGWMGHYLLLTGYDEWAQEFIAQDSYLGADTRVDFQETLAAWRAFNFTYLVAYPPEREADVMRVLGERWDVGRSAEIALNRANREAVEMTGRDQYFAQFNIGTSHNLLQQYDQAAAAFDEAFRLYAELPTNIRPWRMLWYQAGPYEAYYHVGRYQDVINLATTTLDNMTEPILEESFYWRGLAYAALDDTVRARSNFEQALVLNPRFSLAIEQLGKLEGE